MRLLSRIGLSIIIKRKVYGKGREAVGKIDEFEQKLIAQGMTEADFAEYAKMLKRVRGNFLRRQHCYTTAICFPPERAQQAVRLIQFGLESYEDDWFSTYTSYLYMGHIYEKTREYSKAYATYLLAKEALGPERSGYEKELSKELLWMKLHVDSFKYSTELEKYLTCYESAGDFSKAFINSTFRLAVAKAVVALHYGKTTEAKQALETARQIAGPAYKGPLHALLARHNYREELNITPEAALFVRKLKV